MEHIIDPKIRSTVDLIEVAHPGFIATLGLILYDRRRKGSLKEQFLEDVLSVTVRSKVQVYINVIERKKNGQDRSVCLIMSCKDASWLSYCRLSKARIIAWSGKEKF